MNKLANVTKDQREYLQTERLFTCDDLALHLFVEILHFSRSMALGTPQHWFHIDVVIGAIASVGIIGEVVGMYIIVAVAAVVVVVVLCWICYLLSALQTYMVSTCEYAGCFQRLQTYTAGGLIKRHSSLHCSN